VIRALTEDEVALVDAHLPLNRLDTWRAGESTYLVAWDGDTPVGHAHVAWAGTELGLPEVQDVHVPPERRRRGIAIALTHAAEQLAAERGHDRISLSVGVDNEPARSLYAKLGYTDAGLPPKRVRGTILLRGEPFDVDDTLLYLVKRVGVDSRVVRSS
jgi:ribosomal protein S18 acetylase RimI-like enzyme